MWAPAGLIMDKPMLVKRKTTVPARYKELK